MARGCLTVASCPQAHRPERPRPAETLRLEAETPGFRGDPAPSAQLGVLREPPLPAPQLPGRGACVASPTGVKPNSKNARPPLRRLVLKGKKVVTMRNAHLVLYHFRPRRVNNVYNRP